MMRAGSQQATSIGQKPGESRVVRGQRAEASQNNKVRKGWITHGNIPAVEIKEIWSQFRIIFCTIVMHLVRSKASAQAIENSPHLCIRRMYSSSEQDHF